MSGFTSPVNMNSRPSSWLILALTLGLAQGLKVLDLSPNSSHVQRGSNLTLFCASDLRLKSCIWRNSNTACQVATEGNDRVCGSDRDLIASLDDRRTNCTLRIQNATTSLNHSGSWECEIEDSKETVFGGPFRVRVNNAHTFLSNGTWISDGISSKMQDIKGIIMDMMDIFRDFVDVFRRTKDDMFTN
eukprot:maker-scaffold652_size119135-snap-gene-0.16 protein:Tk02006 transcript:maker-scaffold652_size119135-snap-gene-0.16-mRNA-1 annotation:"s22893t-cell receptor alpha chain v region - human"